MKLFSPQAAKIAHNTKQEEDIKEIAYLTVTLRKLQDSINQENENFTKRMEEQRAVYREEKIRLQEDIKLIEKKIAEGEKALLELLLPVDEYSERVKGTLERSQVKALSLMEREEQVTDLEELFTEKLDSLTEREVNVGEAELKIENRLKGMEEESKMIADTHKRLNKEVNEFEATRGAKLRELEEKANFLAVKEERANEYLANRTKELDEQERGLKDRREALDRAFQQLERLQLKANKELNNGNDSISV